MEMLNFNKWHEKYRNDKVFEIKKHINQKDRDLLKKLDIIVEDKIYTMLEFDILLHYVFDYYVDEEEPISRKSLEEKNVTRTDFNKLLNKLMKTRFSKKLN